MSNINSAASTNSVVGQILNIDAIVRDKMRAIILLKRLDVLANQMMDIAEMMDLTNSEYIKRRLLDKYIGPTTEFFNTLSELPERYKAKTIEKIEKWADTNNFEDAEFSPVKFHRTLFRDLLAEVVNN